jgi:hypothetical protein
MTRREHLARERVIRAVLVVTELEQTFGAASMTALDEMTAARRELYQVAIAQGRHQ